MILLSQHALISFSCHSRFSTGGFHISPSGWLWPEDFTSAWFTAVAAAALLLPAKVILSLEVGPSIIVCPACVISHSVELEMSIMMTGLVPILILTSMSISVNPSSHHRSRSGSKIMMVSSRGG